MIAGDDDDDDDEDDDEEDAVCAEERWRCEIERDA
jgi:hypothetical protein